MAGSSNVHPWSLPDEWQHAEIVTADQGYASIVSQERMSALLVRTLCVICSGTVRLGAAASALGARGAACT